MVESSACWASTKSRGSKPTDIQVQNLKTKPTTKSFFKLNSINFLMLEWKCQSIDFSFHLFSLEFWDIISFKISMLSYLHVEMAQHLKVYLQFCPGEVGKIIYWVLHVCFFQRCHWYWNKSHSESNVCSYETDAYSCSESFTRIAGLMSY